MPLPTLCDFQKCSIESVGNGLRAVPPMPKGIGNNRPYRGGGRFVNRPYGSETEKGNGTGAVPYNLDVPCRTTRVLLDCRSAQCRTAWLRALPLKSKPRPPPQPDHTSFTRLPTSKICDSLPAGAPGLFGKLLVLLPGGDDGLGNCGAEGALFQGPDTLEGGAAGGADCILHPARVVAALQHQLGGAD